MNNLNSYQIIIVYNVANVMIDDGLYLEFFILNKKKSKLTV